MSKINIDVNLASQTHHTPHVGFPQREPGTIDINAKIHPIGARLFVIKEINLILKIKINIEAIPINEKQPNEIMEEGT